MNSEDKELLFKDLASRIPYGVIGEYKWKARDSYDRELTGTLYDELKCDGDSSFKPYLRPLSSMTEEERFEAYNLGFKPDIELGMLGRTSLQAKFELRTATNYAMYHHIDWFNKYHFDYRYLIPMDLALKAPEGMYSDKNIVL